MGPIGKCRLTTLILYMMIVLADGSPEDQEGTWEEADMNGEMMGISRDWHRALGYRMCFIKRLIVLDNRGRSSRQWRMFSQTVIGMVKKRGQAMPKLWECAAQLMTEVYTGQRLPFASPSLGTRGTRLGVSDRTNPLAASCFPPCKV